MKKEIALKPPCREYDVQGMESWLQYQSLSGNRLFDTAGRTFYFQEAERKSWFSAWSLTEKTDI